MVLGIAFNVVMASTRLATACEWWNALTSATESRTCQLPHGEAVTISGTSSYASRVWNIGDTIGFKAPVILDPNPEIEQQWERFSGPWNQYKTIFFKDGEERFVLEDCELEIWIGETHAVVRFKPPHVTTKVEHWALAIPQLTGKLLKIGLCGYWMNLNKAIFNSQLPPQRLPRTAEEMLNSARPRPIEFLAKNGPELLAAEGVTPRGQQLLVDWKQARKVGSQLSSHWKHDTIFPRWFRDEEATLLKLLTFPLPSITDAQSRVKTIKNLLSTLPSEFALAVESVMKKIRSHKTRSATARFLDLQLATLETPVADPWDAMLYRRPFPRVNWSDIHKLRSSEPDKAFVASLLVFASCQSCFSDLHAQDAAIASALLAEIRS